jgi:hypothetical protein
MRWVLAIALPVSLAGSPDPGAMLPFEVGVLSCTLGHAIDPEMSTQTGAASDAREMLCTFSRARDGAEETYVGSLKSIRGAISSLLAIGHSLGSLAIQRIVGVLV